MKSRITLSAAALALSVAAGSALATDLELEPAINGAVSANGLHPSQAQEDAAANRSARLALEPCINGAVSASGTHVTQAAEDAAREDVETAFAPEADTESSVTR